MFFLPDGGIAHIDHLSSLLDIESNFNSEDFIPNIPDELHVSISNTIELDHGSSKTLT